MTRRRLVVLIAFGTAALLLVARCLSSIYVDYAWYAAMHATALWRARAANAVLLTGGIAAGAGLFVFANLYAVRRSISTIVLPRRVGNVDIGQAIPGRYLTMVTGLASFVIGIALALPPEPWTELAMARYGVSFGETEPYFQNDLGFFVYWLPLETALYVRALITVLVTSCLVVTLYFALTPSLRWEHSRLSVSPHVRRHAAVCTACVFAALAWSYRLDAYGLLTHGSGPFGAFASVDHHFGIAANEALAVLTIATGIVTAIALWRGQLRTAFVLVTVTIVLPVIASHLVPPLLTRGDPSEVARREAPYAAIRALATRRAYGLDRSLAAPHRPLSAARYGSVADVASAVSIWDPAALAIALGRRHSPQGTTVSNTMDWQWSPGGLLLLAVAWSDGDTTGLAASGGAAVRGPGPVNATLTRVRATIVDDRGAPGRVDSLGRPTTEDGVLPPVLVFDGATEPLIVPDSLERMAAPTIDGFWQRLAHALSEQRLNLLTADLPEPDPRIIERRDVRARVATLAPGFLQGSVIAPIVVADSLYWVVELYTATDAYPLSAHFTVARDDRSYVQHAGRAFVHAATGRVVLVADGSPDPIAETWVRRFPQLFTQTTDLPPALATHVPPPVDEALVVARTIAEAGALGESPPGPNTRQHVVGADGADTALANAETPCVGAPGLPTDMTRPCLWTIPMVDGNNRISGLVVAHGGIEPGVSWYPFAAPGPRWVAVLDRLARAGERDTSASRDTPLVRGRVRTVLVGDSCMFVQPVYSWRAGVPPTVVRVDVATADSAWSVSPPGLLDISGLWRPQIATLGNPSGPALAPAQFRARVRALYDAMQEALHRGDLTAFGVAYRALGAIISNEQP